jgi:hypothetical protein
LREKRRRRREKRDEEKMSSGLMNKIEAQSLLDERIRDLRRLSYSELAALVDKETGYIQVSGPSGAEYNLQTLIFWDDVPHNDIRILVSIDDGGFENAIRDDFVVRRARMSGKG